MTQTDSARPSGARFSRQWRITAAIFGVLVVALLIAQPWNYQGDEEIAQPAPAATSMDFESIQVVPVEPEPFVSYWSFQSGQQGTLIPLTEQEAYEELKKLDSQLYQAVALYCEIRWADTPEGEESHPELHATANRLKTFYILNRIEYESLFLALHGQVAARPNIEKQVESREECKTHSA